MGDDAIAVGGAAVKGAAVKGAAVKGAAVKGAAVKGAAVKGAAVTGAAVDAALEAALRKAAVVWITVGTDAGAAPPSLVWPVWHRQTLYVLHGGDEQAAPGLATATAAGVTVPAKGARELLCSFEAAARQVAPGGPEWTEVLPLLLAKRLNLRDASTAGDRWAEHSALTALTPA